MKLLEIAALSAVIVLYMNATETDFFGTNDGSLNWRAFEMALKKHLPNVYAKLPSSFIQQTAAKEPTVYKSFSKITDKVAGLTNNHSRIITFHKLLRLAGGKSPERPTKFLLQPHEVLFNFCTPIKDTRLRRLENSLYAFLNFLKKVNRPYWVYLMCRWNGHVNINQKPDELGSSYHTGAAYGCLTIDEKKAFVNTTGNKTNSALMTGLHEFAHYIHVGMAEDRVVAPITDYHDAKFREILNALHEYATAPSPSGLGWKLLISVRSFDYSNGTRCPRCTLFS
jgi:hypothetical protein